MTPGGGSESGMGSLVVQAVLTGWTWVTPWDVLLLVLAAGYLVGLWRLRRAGTHWRPGRTTSFLAGLAALVLAVNSGIGTEARSSATVHMVQHLLLIAVVPVALIGGRPWELCASTGARGSALVRRVRENLVTRVVLHPAFGVALYTVVLIGTHLTPFLHLAAAEAVPHGAEEVLYLVTGYVFLLPLAGFEPIRPHLAYPLRMFVVLISMIVDTVVGVAMMMSMTPMAGMTPGEMPGMSGMPDASSALTDMHWAGAVMWVVGDGLMMGIGLVIAAKWSTDTTRQNDTGGWLDAARRDALARIGGEPTPAGDASDGADGAAATASADSADLADADLDADDRALAAYNRMLARLHTRDTPQRKD